MADFPFNHYFTDSEIQEIKASSVLALVSGGPDSVFLLFLLHEFLTGTLEVLHVNHHLRGVESDDDEKFVRDVCEKLGVGCHVKNFFFKNESGNFHGLAREARLRFAFEICRQRNLDVISTAHHQDDLIETLCMRKSRGGGLKGLSGMRRRQVIQGEWGTKILWRPLLDLPKSEIFTWLQTNQKRYRDDSSNQNPSYFRNRVRCSLNQDFFPRQQILDKMPQLQNIGEYFDDRLAFLKKIYQDFVPTLIWESWPEELQFQFFSFKMRERGYHKQVENRHFKIIKNHQRKITLDQAQCWHNKKGWFFARAE